MCLAHTEAFENAGILHRDISVGNVLINDEGGLLIDWDLSKDIRDLDRVPRQPFRTVCLDVHVCDHPHIVDIAYREHGNLFPLDCYKPGSRYHILKLMTGSRFSMS